MIQDYKPAILGCREGMITKGDLFFLLRSIQTLNAPLYPYPIALACQSARLLMKFSTLGYLRCRN